MEDRMETVRGLAGKIKEKYWPPGKDQLLILVLVGLLLAAVLQPISDERITGCLAGVGCGMKLLFQTICMVLVLFLLTVALTTAITGR